MDKFRRKADDEHEEGSEDDYSEIDEATDDSESDDVEDEDVEEVNSEKEEGHDVKVIVSDEMNDDSLEKDKVMFYYTYCFGDIKYVMDRL